MNVLMIAQIFPPYGTVGGSIRLTKFLKYLVQGKFDWSPTVVTLRDDIDLLFVGRNSAFSLEDIPVGLDILRTNTSEFQVPKGMPTGLYSALRKLMLALAKPVGRQLLLPDHNRLWRRHLMDAVRKRLVERHYDAIYATAPPFSVLLAASDLKAETGLPLILDIKDDWMDVDRYRGVRRWRWPIERRMEARCAAAADHIITVTEKSQSAFRARYPEMSERIHYIPNGCDVDEYRPLWAAPPNKFERFTMVHAGVFSSRRDLSALFSVIRQLSDKHTDFATDFEFLLIGRLPKDQAKSIKRFGVTDMIRVEDYLPRDQYLQILCSAHLPVVINYKIGTLIPGKIYEYWGSRNRMLLLDGSDSAAADLVRKYNIGDVVAPDNERGIMEVLLRSWRNHRDGNTLPLTTEGLELFDRKHLTARLAEVLDATVGRVR